MFPSLPRNPFLQKPFPFGKIIDILAAKLNKANFCIFREPVNLGKFWYGVENTHFMIMIIMNVTFKLDTKYLSLH